MAETERLGKRLAQLEQLLSHDEWQPVESRVALWRELRLICEAAPHLHSYLSTPADVEMIASYWEPPPCARCGSLLDGTFDEESGRYQCWRCAGAAARPGLEHLHVELLATQPLDFRDLLCLAATSAAARGAVQRGPLHLITDIKRIITSAPVLRLPEYGPTAGRYVIQADASGLGIGAVLLQFESGQGFHTGDTFKPAQRLPVSAYVHRNGW